MKSDDKTREQLLKEIDILKAKITKLQQSGIGTKKAKKALLIEKQFSENILETANALILTLDIKANITLFNKFAEKFTGYKKEEVLGKNWFDLFIPKCNGSKITEVFSNVLKKMPELSSYENPILCKNGSERLIRWENTVMKNENGEISGVLSIGVDITEHKMVESKLEINEKMLHQIIDTSPDCIFLKDWNGMYLMVNKKMSELHKTTPEKLVGKYDYEIAKRWFEAVDYKEFRKAEQDVIDNKKSLFIKEEAFGYYNGTERWFQTTKIPFELKDNKKCLLVISTDISERKQAEETIHESENNLRALFNAMKDVVFEMDYDGRYINIAPTASDLLYKPSNEALGKTFHEVFPQSQADKFLEFIRKCIDKNKANTIEYPMIINDKTIWFEGRATPKTNNSVLYIAHDITERKQAQEKLKENSLELEKQYEKSEKQRVATLSVLSDLNETTKELRLEIAGRKRSQAIQKALYDISNALNTTDKMHDFYSKIRKFLRNVIDTTNFFVALYDEKTDSISLPFNVDEKDNYKTFPAGKTLTKYVIQTSKPLFATNDVVEDLTKKGVIETIGAHSEIWLGTPLKIDNKVIGIIAVQSYDDPDLYSKKDIEILTFISDEIALAIKHKQAEEKIRRELKEKVVLLREVHHRVKNNLQVISGLLQLQQNEITTKEDALKGFASSQDRILAMAKAYELLLGSDYMSEVSVGKYIESLAEQLKQNYDIHNKVNITYSLDELKISIEILDRLGLILNEIITNAIKYAFEGIDSGNIHIELKDAEDHMEIKISDNGIGIPPKIKVHEPATLGLSIVDMLTEQLRGTIKLDRKNGTSFTLVVPKNFDDN